MKKAQPANFPEFEQEMLQIWDKEKTFQQSLANRASARRFRFYDGPPFANGLPHYGHALASTEKDAVTRYKTMRGYYVPRRAGWDTHGLPVEYEVEKQKGLKNKREIVEYGVAKFNQAARDSVFKYLAEWEQFFHRLGRWIDTENAYATLNDNYIESVWWVFSQLHEKGLVYRDFRSSPYCPRCATPLSNFELNQGYQDGVEDPSVYVKFKEHEDRGLNGRSNSYFLAWTTTPWTLPANAALAVDTNAEYVTVEMTHDGDGWAEGDWLTLAKDRVSELDLRKADYKEVDTRQGSELIGKQYYPLYEIPNLDVETANNAYKIYADESVSLDDGTGILHVAPRYGEADLALGQRESLPLIESVDADGRIATGMKAVDGLADTVGIFFKDADKVIIENLTKNGKLFAAETFTHTYPFCWRCDTPLMYFATPSWFVQVTKLRQKLVDNNQQISWVPAHVKDGRFGNWLAEARDWSVSRNRFWGAPIPIWINADDETDIVVVGSLAELRELSGHSGNFDLHRPGIDQIVIKKDGKTYRRVDEVFDCWFESGSMPYAEDHYPFEHKAEFETGFPAEFIAEGMDQTRGWFYTLHVLATALFEKPAFQNVIVSGTIVAADGKKLSKRLKNYPAIDEIFTKYGADSLRLFLSTSPAVAGEDVRFSDDAVRDVYRNVFMTLWNVYSFFSTYAEVDGWAPPKKLEEPQSDNVLDRWMVARLNQVIVEMTKQADAYQLNRATRPLRELIDDLSNWYVRRSRRRFWKSEDDGDKQAAYATLHYALVRLSQLLAPWSPFVSDKLWRELTAGLDLPASVHLSDWPEAGEIDSAILKEMTEVRKAIEMGLSQRAEAKIKVRQPLPHADILMTELPPTERANQYVDIGREELNVKTATLGQSHGGDGRLMAGCRLDTNLTPELRREGLVRDVIRLVQNLRKQAGLQVDDRIRLSLQTEDEELRRAIDERAKTIAAETLALEVTEALLSNAAEAKVGDATLKLSLEKA